MELSKFDLQSLDENKYGIPPGRFHRAFNLFTFSQLVVSEKDCRKQTFYFITNYSVILLGCISKIYSA